MEFSKRTRFLGIGWFLACGLIVVEGSAARAQIPGLPGLTKPSTPAKADTKNKPTAAPTRDNPEATVATTSGPIDVEKPVDDRAVQRTLEDLLPRYPGVRRVKVTVSDGYVTLEGHVEDEDRRDDVTDFAKRVEGVRIVLNLMKTDAQVLTAQELAMNVLREIGQAVTRKWLVALLAVAIALLALGLARLFGGYAEMLLAPFIENVLLRSVVGSLLSSFLVVGGVMLGLWMLDLTHAVLSILGLAGVVGLAVGFAFRDITENFIASILLGVRRPFRIGDYVQVAGQAGVVKTLNTRATVLVTLEGNQVRIPNNIIYKEIMINSSASTSTRGNFDVIVPYEVSTATAQEAMTRALCEQEGILPDPPPRALIEALETGGVRLRAYFWTPTQGVDGFKLLSDTKLRVKVALQQAGITPPPTGVVVSVAGRVPVDVSEVDGHVRAETILRPGAIITAEQAEANLRHDSRAAARAADAPANGQQTPMEHALSQAESHVSDEGENLLPEPNGKPGGEG
jgi:small conductance mechanosensitive channel